jgi:glycosyltransferase involved in cell wall biosynthesis/SAM-dependent methyltransferase
VNSLEVVIVAPGMPFAADTLHHKSLGGSETAALSLAKALKERGHIVTVFCVLPAPGSPDFIGEHGGIGIDGVRYVDVNQYFPFISTTEVDLLIVQRNPQLLQVNHQARKAVLWAHDLATYNGPTQMLQGIGWNMDEIWCVSEWHANQYAKVTGYPREFIKVLRNAITAQDVIPSIGKDDRQLVYAARPERGLEALVRPGGIMSRLPEFTLNVSMYENVPEHMQGYYAQLFAWADALPNVRVHGFLTQLQLRTLMDQCGGYVYPTNFEETSCILAQEALERGMVFLTTHKGALPETLNGNGILYDGDHDWNSDEFCQDFADMVRDGMACASTQRALIANEWVPRYWEDAASDVERLFYAKNKDGSEKRNNFSLLWSLVEDSDIMSALAFTKVLQGTGEMTPRIRLLHDQLLALYPYLTGQCTFAEYYERYFVREDSKGARQRRSMVGNPRFESISAEVAALHDGAHIIDYGCAEGVIILDLAKRFPSKNFIGIDFAKSNVELCQKYAADMGLTNVRFHHGSTDNWPLVGILADAVICTEVLEHVERPWEVIKFLEDRVLPGGRVIITVPMGPWEAIGLYDPEQFYWRAHIWHINKWMLRKMFSDKQDCRMSSLPGGATADGRALGHTTFSYTADHRPVHPVDPLDKAYNHRPRQTVTACIVTGREDTLLHMLKSIGKQVQVVHLMTTDNHNEVARTAHRFLEDHPWLQLQIQRLPKIEARKFGFDDARNMSVQDVETDWVLWIDDDEYLSGDFRKYLRANAFDAYAIHQHHFTCDPRGAPTQLDKPARLFRTDRGFTFYGKVHEHAEKGENGGPGFCFILPDVDIGHIGYANETVRRDRFNRNFPFLEWDHEVNPNRNIGKFLWLRDIIHRMRYFAEIGQVERARALALEGVDYYKTNWKEWSQVGMGGEQAMGYYGEALGFLGRGLPVTVQFKIGEATGQYGSVFDSEDEAIRVLHTHLKGHFDNRRSGYWS